MSQAQDIMEKIDTKICETYPKVNGLELLMICKIMDIVRNILSEELEVTHG